MKSATHYDPKEGVMTFTKRERLSLGWVNLPYLRELIPLDPDPDQGRILRPSLQGHGSAYYWSAFLFM